MDTEFYSRRQPNRCPDQASERSHPRDMRRGQGVAGNEYRCRETQILRRPKSERTATRVRAPQRQNMRYTSHTPCRVKIELHSPKRRASTSSVFRAFADLFPYGVGNGDLAWRSHAFLVS